ncbi:MAG: hypothetical protein COB67_02410 [SAR324 cluster bacterium]|uniref:Uncharacterized protein n=1 Tax=SAR324 cluster bacterium TaxID=2024889 RepID=A0A2A4TAZ9_9DELT|nr:MAG: hypothetical protein COB67_02410 [SAR324 cluster bacterium]
MLKYIYKFLLVRRIYIVVLFLGSLLLKVVVFSLENTKSFTSNIYAPIDQYIDYVINIRIELFTNSWVPDLFTSENVGTWMLMLSVFFIMSMILSRLTKSLYRLFIFLSTYNNTKGIS